MNDYRLTWTVRAMITGGRVHYFDATHKYVFSEHSDEVAVSRANIHLKGEALNNDLNNILFVRIETTEVSRKIPLL